MTVYVDEIADYSGLAKVRFLPSTHWAHLTADTRDELHTFASRLGLRRSWFQDHPTRWHYDVTTGKRAQALRLGATAVTDRELATITLARLDRSSS
jgi:hypothetical protein